MDQTKIKTIFSVALVLLATVLTVAATIDESKTTVSHRSPDGFSVDRGNYDTEWIEAPRGNSSIEEMLSSSPSVEILFDDMGKILSVDSLVPSEGQSWDVWVVYNGETSMKKLFYPYVSKASSFNSISVALTKEGETPATAVDALGNSIYGYSNSEKIVTTSPTVSEIACSVGGLDAIIGCDTATDYPSDLVSRIGSEVTTVGDMLKISFENLIALNPDAVILDYSVTSQRDIANRLSVSTSITSVMIFSGNDEKSMLDNIHIIGTVLGTDYSEKTSELCSKIVENSNTLSEICSHATTTPKCALVLYYQGFAPWGVGNVSMFSDIVAKINVKNLFDIEMGWFEFNQEEFVNLNPDYIIILNSDFENSATGYSNMIQSLKDNFQWETTNAMKNGNIYMVSEHAGDVFQRNVARYVQCQEIMARWTHPDLFSEYGEIPKFIGNEYKSYLKLTGEIS